MWWIGSVQSVIVHSVFFVVCFLLPILQIVEWDQMLLVLTTVVSLEAIYLAIFIQMSVNKSTEHIEDLKEDVTEIQEDIEEISDDIEDIQEDIEEINDDENDDEDHGERARKVMLKSKVATNKTEINSLKNKISEMEALIRKLQDEDDKIEENF